MARVAWRNMFNCKVLILFPNKEERNNENKEE